MDHEKKYNELVGKIKKAYLYAQTDSTKAVLEDILPELRESEDEDEKIRKEIISALKYANHNGVYDKHLAWLEKQKEFVSVDFDDVWKTADCDELTAPLEKYSKDAIKKMCHAWYDKGIEFERKRCLEKQGEQKSNDKVEPKFKNGQWIVWQDKCYKVNYNGCGYELVDQNGLSTSLEYGTIDENAHLWTIQDAKPGDVLVASDGSIFLFGGVDDSACKYYAALTTDNYIKINKEAKGGYRETSRAVYPATKEQRDLLFQKMKEAGYMWDAEKKELKKTNEEFNGEDYGIDSLFHAKRILEKTLGKVDGYQSDDGILEHKCAIASVNKLYKQKTAWSEEDEHRAKDTIYFLDTAKKHYASTVELDACIDWLKSLKNKVAPQKQWKPSDEQMKALDWVLSLAKNCGEECSFDLRTLYERLREEVKKL